MKVSGPRNGGSDNVPGDIFSDLNQAAQQRVLDFYGYSDPRDGNFDLDIEPLCVLESDLEDD